MKIETVYELHELATIFPPMGLAEFAGLKSDIEQNGQLEPIWIHEGRVIDGRHRLLACQELGIEPEVEEYTGDNPMQFVVSRNLHRRHLNESQRAMIGAKLANLERGDNQHSSIDLCSQKQASELLNVSVPSIKRAVEVHRNAATPAIIHAVEAGNMSVSLASQVAKLPEEEQEVVASVADEPQQMRDVARDVIHNHRAQGTGQDEWYTPQEYVDAARRVMGSIDLDPASNALAQSRIQAGAFYTLEDDGLSKDWSGRVWLNPPYAQPAIMHFIEKLVQSIGPVTEAILLTHNYTDTRWFHVATRAAKAICFTRGRIGFVSPEGKRAAPTQGQAFFYFGDNVEAFTREFCKFGFIATVACPYVEGD